MGLRHNMTNSAASSWYRPILNEGKLNSGTEILGYLESGAATIRSIKE